MRASGRAAMADLRRGAAEAAGGRLHPHLAAEYADLNKAAFKLVGVRSFVFAGPWVLDHASWHHLVGEWLARLDELAAGSAAAPAAPARGPV